MEKKISKSVTNTYYQYVSLNNEYMRMAYLQAKKLYKHGKWNKKTTPVAIIVLHGGFVAKGIAANGRHALFAKCSRLGEKNTPYDDCNWCIESQHAERYALNAAGKIDLKGGKIYLYGHYRFCDACLRALEDRGIYDYFLLKNSETLFDRHKPGTILGTDQQFIY